MIYKTSDGYAGEIYCQCCGVLLLVATNSKKFSIVCNKCGHVNNVDLDTWK